MRWIFTVLLLTACAPAPEPASIYREVGRTEPQTLVARPDYPGYGLAIGKQPIPWSAESLASDFRKLLFATEWGDKVPNLLKWEGPVTVSLKGPELALYKPFAEDLLSRIRASAPDLDVRLTDGKGDITLRSAPRREMDFVASDALCFFIPYHTDWEAFFRFGQNGWDQVERYDAVTIFIPEFAPPHEIRSCILEEVTQALGPGNDISALEDSIYNDDNAHVWPTKLDYLMLNLLYNPKLSNGMEEEATIQAVKSLARSRTTGERNRGVALELPAYDIALNEATADGPLSRRQAAAGRAVVLAENHPIQDHRLGEAYKAAAYVAFEAKRPADVVRNLRRAEEAHVERLSPDSIHLARVRAELAINLINLEQYETGRSLLAKAIPVFAANGADWQLAHAFRWRAIALSQLGRVTEARGEALEALDWARYVYGRNSRAAAVWTSEFVEIGLIPQG